MEINIGRLLHDCKYWFSLVTALYYAGIITCLKIFHDKASPTGLPTNKKQLHLALTKQKSFLDTLRTQGVITLDEWDQIFTEKGETDSSEFDLGLLLTLLQAISLPEPEHGWMEEDPDDTSTAGFLIRLRLAKDKITRMEDPRALNEEKYSELWEELCEIFYGLDFDVTTIYAIHHASRGEKFYFLPKDGLEFSFAFTRAKILYIHKAMSDLKTLYDRHLENVITVRRVVRSSKMEKVETRCVEFKRPIRQLEDRFDHLRKRNYKHAVKFLTECERLYTELKIADHNLDVVIEKYNANLEEWEEKIKTERQEQHNKKPERKGSLSVRKADMISWFRRNTIRIRKISRSRSLSNADLHQPPPQTVRDLGDF